MASEVLQNVKSGLTDNNNCTALIKMVPHHEQFKHLNSSTSGNDF